MNVSYDYYRIFYYVGTYGSFTRAAKALGNSQPNITRAMNNLESALQCRLFLRSHRGVTLTPEGQRLYLHIKAAHQHIEAGEQALLQDQQLLSGYLSVGVSEIALHGMLLPILQQFRLRYPGIHVQTTNHTTPQAVGAIENGLVDLALVTSPTDIAPPLVEQPLRQFQEILIAGPGFSELRDRRVALKEISSFPLICLGRDTTTFRFLRQVFAEQGLPLEPDLEAATTEQVLLMVQYDLGLGFVPPFLAKEALKNGSVFQVQLDFPMPSRYISMIWSNRHPLSPAAKAFNTLVQGCRG